MSTYLKDKDHLKELVDGLVDEIQRKIERFKTPFPDGNSPRWVMIIKTKGSSSQRPLRGKDKKGNKLYGSTCYTDPILHLDDFTSLIPSLRGRIFKPIEGYYEDVEFEFRVKVEEGTNWKNKTTRRYYIGYRVSEDV